MTDTPRRDQPGARWEDGEIIERRPGTNDTLESPFERPDPTEAPLPADDEDKVDANPTGN